MKIFLTVMMASMGLVMGLNAQAAAEKKKAKPSMEFMGKTYYLGDDISAGKTMAVNRYYREGSGPNKLGGHLLQRFILTKDDGKTVATNMAKSFEKMGKVTVVDDVAPGVTGLVTTEAGEKAAFVRISIFKQSKKGNSVFVKSWDIAAPAMTKEKLEGIAAKFQKSTLEALVKAKFPRMVLPPKKAPKK